MDVKIAVIGQSGDGKSSFINKVLGEDIAQVSFTEKSEERVEEYFSPLNDSIKFYEIPAITGLEFNRDNFFEKANFPANRYDYVFFITKDKRSSDDYFLLQELQKRQFPFSILRTHIDEVVDKARNRAQGSNVEENMVLEQTRQTMKDKMESRGVNSEAVEIHLIDNSVPSNFDFQAAIRQMQDSLPDQKAQLMQGTLLSVLSNEDTIVYEEIEKWQDALVNIAVVGDKSCGKTSYVKTILGETVPDLPTISTTGSFVYECTENDKIKLHEIETNQMKQLLEQPEKMETTFDYVFLLTKHEISDEHNLLLEMFLNKQIATSVLRTHVDVLVQNERRESKKEKLIERNEKTIIGTFETRGLDKKKLTVHSIDSRNFSEFRFLEAMESLLSNLEEAKRVSLIKSMTIFENCSNWSQIRVDIAVVGQSRHGKSSLINAIVGSYVAEVGHIGNMTKEVQQYSIPNHPNINLYDVPGISSTDCTREEFDGKAKLDENNYDLFFMVVKDVFNDDCEFIRQKISRKKEKKPFSIVRTHVDQTMGNFYSTREPRQSTEKRICAEIRENLELQLRKLGADSTQIYLVDLTPGKESKFDFPQLMEDIARELPKVKRQAFLLSVTSFDPNMIEAKYKELWWIIFGCALGSGVGGLIPIPGVSMTADVGIFVAATVKILSSFGLTKEKIAAQEKRKRLKRGLIEDKLVAFMQKQEFEILMAIRNSPYCKEGLIAASNGAAKIGVAIIPILGRTLGLVTVDEIIKATVVFVAVGMVVGSISSFGVTLYLLQKELKNAKSCALFVSSLIQPTSDHS